MKNILFLILTLLSIQSMAQNIKGTATVDGLLIDTTSKKPIEFATIALIDATSNQTLDGSIADEKGAFIIKNIASGSYILEFEFLGYSKKRMNLTIKEGAKLKLNKIYLSQETLTLKEVTVEAQSQIIEEKVDRLVYNAEKDINSKGGDAADVMRNVPLLTVDLDGNVSLRGNSNVRVLINNKPSSIMAGSVADALKQIPADMIKSIEVITSPGARYDSEGSSGIINIITKKQTLQGLTLGVDISAGNRGGMLGLNGNYRQGNMGFSLRGHGRAEYNVKGAYENIQSTQTSLGLQSTTQSASTLRQGGHGSYNFGYDWDISKKSNFSAGIRFGTRSGVNFQDDLRTVTKLPNVPTPLISARNVDSKDLNFSYDINTTYTYTITPEKELSILGLYSRNNRNNSFEADLLNNVDFQTITARQKNDNISFNEESTLEVNYQAPTSKRSLIEFGGKGIFRNANSDYQYFFAEGKTGEYTLDESRASNVLDYNQMIGGGYLSYTLSTPKKFTIKAGSRLEYTDITAAFDIGSANKIPSYWSLVPSINVSKPISQKMTLKAAYNKRIQRPGIQYLNPNVNESNPTNISVGNPYLDPELTDNYELSSSINLKGVFITAAMFYRYTGNSITSLKDTFSVRNPNPGVEGSVPAIRTTYQNIGNENTVGINLFGNVTLFKIWSLHGGVDVYNVHLSNNNPNPNYASSNSGLVIGGRMFTNVRFKNGWGLQGGAGGRGRQINLQGNSGGFVFYSLGLRKNFTDGKGNFSISAENFFNHPFNQISRSKSNLLDQLNTNSFYNAGIRAGISYRFGKMTFQEKRRKSINNDDLKSEGGGGMGGDSGGSSEGSQNSGTTRTGSGQRPNTTTGNTTPGQKPQSTGTTTNTQGSNQPGTQGRSGANPADIKIMHDTMQLSPDQIKAFDEIELKYRTKMRTMMEESRANGSSREEMRPKMETLRVEQEAELKTILSEGQLTLYKKIVAERATRFAPGGGPRQ